MILSRFVPLSVSLTRKVSSIQGGDCTSFIERNGQNQRVLVSEPALWTENWMGWFDAWGGKAPAGDWPTFESTEQSASKAFGILRWTARGGSHVNFYNWAGGTHFARNAGSSMVNVYLPRQTFLLVLSPFRSTDLFCGAGTAGAIRATQPGAGSARPTATQTPTASSG